MRKKGSILILSLWSVCLLATYAVILGFNTRQSVELTRRLEERGRLRFAAEAGILKAIAMLRSQEESSYFPSEDIFSNNPVFFKGMRIGDAEVTISYDSFDNTEGLTLRNYGFQDEERKININLAKRPVLQRLFKVVLNLNEMQAQDLAASIIDWRDQDSELSVPTGSAEDSFYRFLKYPYEAKDANFQVLNELHLVKGVSDDLYNILKDYLTVYGTGMININTASEEVLLALGLSQRNVRMITSYRNGKDKTFGTPDDNVFTLPSAIVSRLSQHFGLSASDIATINNIVNMHMTTNSNYFTVNARASLNNKNLESKVVSVIDGSGRILYWQEA
ncbi:general secretion pathway protein GspK [Candidatus Omnitrophota bacterium]